MNQKIDMERLTRDIKELAKRSGAVLVGIASIDRFEPMPPYYDRIPKGQDPRVFLPNAKSVISISQPLMNAAVDAPAVLGEMELEMIPPEARRGYLDAFYYWICHANLDVFLLAIGQVVGQELMANGFDAMIFPTPGVHWTPSDPVTKGKTEQEVMQGPSKAWGGKYAPFKYASGPFSHRHAATRAGLGEFGYNNIVLTPQFGARQRFNSIITDAELIPDPLITKPICLRDACMLCIRGGCPMDAITLRDDPNVRDYRSVEKVDRNIIFIDTPSKTDPVLCLKKREVVPTFPITCLSGDCLRVCPRPKVPKHLTKRLSAIVDEWKRPKG
jgi:epoxyqueuosine reductase QueG